MKAVCVINSAGGIADRNHFATNFFELTRGRASHLTKSLNRYSRFGIQFHFDFFGSADDGIDNPATRRFFAPQRTPDIDWFSGYHARYGMALLLAVGIHDPSHHL